MRVQALMVAAVGLVGCSDIFIQNKPSDNINVDNRLILNGRVCTDPPDQTGFPVKVVLIVDQSGSMCVSDPPGAQETVGFCEMAAALLLAAGIPPVTEPARVRALKRLVDQFAQAPNVSISMVPFETNVKNPYPATTNGSRFIPVNAATRPGIVTAMEALQSQLGKGTDYQGALSYAYTVVADDINDTMANNPEVLPRTRYVVVFLTDGTPYPRCSGDDSLTEYATADNPELLWEDSSGTGGRALDGFCQLGNPQPPTPPFLNGFVAGTDRNQNYQLFSYVDQLMLLKDQYNIGDIRLHTVLLFNEASVRACGAMCEDLYGTYPGVPPGMYPQAAKKIATWTLQQLAQRGNGVYQEFVDADIQSLGLGALDYSSLSSRNVMKQLLVTSMSSAPGFNERGEPDRVLDTDGDGLADVSDQLYNSKSNPLFGDTDGDCFSDNFEVRHYDEGFRTDQKDTRGCDPNSVLTPGCDCNSDTDGDGLPYQVEAYLHTSDTLMDSDADGVPDGIEVRYGLDAVKRGNLALDTDGDGLPDVLEIRSESSPIKRDKSFFEKEAYQYETNAEIQPDESVCYDFSVSNLKLVTPPSQAGIRHGYNLFKVYFAQAPESGIASDYGLWRTACAWAQYAPPSVRVPAGPDLTFTNANFVAPRNLVRPSQYAAPGACIGTGP